MRVSNFGFRVSVLLLSAFCFLLSAFPQQPQAQSGQPVYSVNAKWVNGVAPGYWPTAGSGLTLNLSAGSALCGSPALAMSYAGGTLTMTASNSNYVYLDTTNSCVPAVNTSGFPTGSMPLAVVVAGASTISSINDLRLAPQTNPTTAPNYGVVKYAVTFAVGSSPDAQIAACIASFGMLPGICYTDGVTGAFTGVLIIATPGTHLVLGAGTLDVSGYGIQVNADNVKITGQGEGVSFIKSTLLYQTAVRLGSSTVVPGPANFEFSGITLQGPLTYRAGWVNTSSSGNTVTWLNGPQFTGLVANGYIQISGVTYQISGTPTATSLTLATSPGNQTNAIYVVTPYIGYVTTSAALASGTYSSGGTLAGTGTCGLSSFNGGGSSATATVPVVSGAIAAGTALTVTAGGSGYTTSPTTATFGSCTGGATASGSATISTLITGPLTYSSGSTFAGLGATPLSPGDYSWILLGSNPPQVMQISSVTGSTSLTVSAAFSMPTSPALYVVSSDGHGTEGLGMAGAFAPFIHNAEFTGWGQCAICLGPATDGSGNFATTSQARIIDVIAQGNAGEPITIYAANKNNYLNWGFNLVTHSQLNGNGLSCFDTNARGDVFSDSECNLNGGMGKNGDSSNFQIHNADDTVANIHADFGNQWGASVAGTNQKLSGLHVCGTTGYIGTGYGLGIQVGSASEPAVGVSITGSTVCDGPTHGIALESASQTILSNNHSNGNTGYGIFVFSGNSDTQLIGNDATGNTEGAIADTGTNTMLVCNVLLAGTPCQVPWGLISGFGIAQVPGWYSSGRTVSGSGTNYDVPFSSAYGVYQYITAGGSVTPVTIGGIVAPAGGAVAWLVIRDSWGVGFSYTNADTGESTAANRLYTGSGASISFPPSASTLWMYTPDSTNWSLMASSAPPLTITAANASGGAFNIPPLGTPSALTAAPTIGIGSLAAGTYYYKLTVISAVGETQSPAEASCTLSATGECAVSATVNSLASSCKVYGRGTGAETYMTTGVIVGRTCTYTDTGSATPDGVHGPPAADTTAGITVAGSTTLPNSVAGTAADIADSGAPTCSATGFDSSPVTCLAVTGSNSNRGKLYAQTGTTPAASGTFTITFPTARGANGIVCHFMLDQGNTAWPTTSTIMSVMLTSKTVIEADWATNGAALSAGYYSITYSACGPT